MHYCPVVIQLNLWDSILRVLYRTPWWWPRWTEHIMDTVKLLYPALDNPGFIVKWILTRWRITFRFSIGTYHRSRDFVLLGFLSDYAYMLQKQWHLVTTKIPTLRVTFWCKENYCFQQPFVPGGDGCRQFYCMLKPVGWYQQQCRELALIL